MVGISGVLGGGTLPPEMAAWTTWRDEEREFEYGDERVELNLSCHSLLAGDQPVTVDDGDALVWVWGDVYGDGSGGDYAPRRGPPDGSAAYCARRYREEGLSFVEELNGDFVIIVYDRVRGTLAFAVDRMSVRPVYYATPTDDAFVFASALQSLPHHPDVRAQLDREYLQEYLALRRVFGVETPLSGVRELPPASVVEVDLYDLSVETTSYWRPRYDPVDKPFSYFVERLADTLQSIFREWTRDRLSYGVLLSGGGDSRLVQSCIDQPVVSFHNADWMSREARVAKRVTEASDDEFRLLERYDDHEARSLETTPVLSNFSGWFDQAYFTEFEDEIAGTVDVLVSGMFADMLFAGGPLATRDLSLGSIGTVSLPVRRPIETVDDYVDAKLEESQPLPYFASERSLRQVLSDNIERVGGGILSHGVYYDSLTDLVMYGDYHPLGADTEAIFSHSLMQMRPYRTPFLDNRIIDLHRRMPTKYFLRRNVINAAVEEVDAGLADIPHARTGVPLKYPFPLEYLGTNVHGFHRKYIGDDPAPEPHLDHKPWPNRRELLRVDPFAIECIRENEDMIRRLPFLDYDAAVETYRSHLDGEDRTTVLYSLLTLLEMPLAESVAGSGVVDPPSEVLVVSDDGRRHEYEGESP